MEMFLVFGVFFLVFGIFLWSMEEKKIREHKIFTCVDIGIQHDWAYNYRNELQCRSCYVIAGKKD